MEQNCDAYTGELAGENHCPFLVLNKYLCLSIVDSNDKMTIRLCRMGTRVRGCSVRLNISLCFLKMQQKNAGPHWTWIRSELFIL